MCVCVWLCACCGACQHCVSAGLAAHLFRVPVWRDYALSSCSRCGRRCVVACGMWCWAVRECASATAHRLSCSPGACELCVYAL